MFQGQLQGRVSKDRIGIDQVVVIASLKQHFLCDDGCQSKPLNLLFKEGQEQSALQYIVTTGNAETAWREGGDCPTTVEANQFFGQAGLIGIKPVAIKTGQRQHKRQSIAVTESGNIGSRQDLLVRPAIDRAVTGIAQDQCAGCVQRRDQICCAGRAGSCRDRRWTAFVV